MAQNIILGYDSTMESGIRRGYIVHAYMEKRRFSGKERTPQRAEPRRKNYGAGNRLYILGRLEDGRSFAAVQTLRQPSFHIYQRDRESVLKILSSFQVEAAPARFESFEGNEKLLEIKFKNNSGKSAAASMLEENGIPSPDGDQKPAEAFLAERGIKGAIQIEGTPGKGRLVDLVFENPLLSPCDGFSPLEVPLRLCSIDIETEIKTGAILAVGFSVYPWNSLNQRYSLVRVLLPESSGQMEDAPHKVVFHPDEKSLLLAFLDDIRKADPDVLTGWNFLDFDFPRLAERFAFYNIPFTLGRSPEEAKFFSGGSAAGIDSPGAERRRSAAAFVPGRQVIDALRIVRGGPQRHISYTLESVAGTVLGLGKTITSSGDQKIEDLKALYRNDPLKFGIYCLRDAELVSEILDRTGLFRLTLERASLTGVSLDKAWTSVVSFERVYGTELFRRKTAPPPKANLIVSGAAGGTVLDPLPGFFSNVGVFDFRSLYPTIMLTFNIDPLSHIRADKQTAVIAPNGAAFSRERGILPELIASYFASRRKALDEGDEEASHVYKILMNSFYGVLGTPSCRYGRTELAGAITSFARKWLLFSRDWFMEKGYAVLYGDTDSLFVESGLKDDVSYRTFFEWGTALTKELNLRITDSVKAAYNLISFLELRFEKPYRRFMIPPLRNFKSGEGRGRAKGYGGWLLDSEGGLKTEVKGMEAVRSDSTPLARRIQVELLELVFKGGGIKELKDHVYGILKELRRGLLDEELIYRKRLSRPPESYTASTPPQVKAARALGWKNRRGTVEYVWTVSGPEPAGLPHQALDYDHYAGAQVLSVARSIASAAGWNSEIFPHYKKDHLSDAQMELDF